MLPSLAFRVPPGASRMRLGGLPGPSGWLFGGLPVASRGFPGASGKLPGAKKTYKNIWFSALFGNLTGSDVHVGHLSRPAASLGFTGASQSLLGGLSDASREPHGGFLAASGKPPGCNKIRENTCFVGLICKLRGSDVHVGQLGLPGAFRGLPDGVHLVRMVTIKRTNIPWQNWVRGVTGIWLFFIRPRTQFRTQPEKR